MTVTVAERVTRTALLGVRFWDRVTGRPVATGLELVELSSGQPATAGPSAIFAFHDLPGFSASSYGQGDASFWASPPEHGDVRFRVRDLEQRFLPFTFDAEVPLRGVFVEDCGSPPDPLGAVPLFSAASRAAPAGFARVTADVVDVLTGGPAAYAVLEITAGTGPTHRGVADADGRVSVILAYPEPPADPGGSPPPGSLALTALSWPLTVTVRYTPAVSPYDPPDLCAVLQQPAATALAAASPATPLGAQTLAFGRELALKTPGHSELLVLPA